MDKKESILEATLKLTTEIGWVDTSTALIAKEANVGMGTIYRYFESKEQLFYDLFIRLKQKLNEIVISSFSFEKDPFENFETVVRNLLLYYTENMREFRYLETYSDLTSEIPERIDDTLLPLEPITNFLNGWNNSFQLKPLPIDVIFGLIYGPLVAIANLVHMKKLVLTDQIISDISKACWDSIIVKN